MSKRNYNSVLALMPQIVGMQNFALRIMAHNSIFIIHYYCEYSLVSR